MGVILYMVENFLLPLFVGVLIVYLTKDFKNK